jgi:hypothetical protein
MFMKMVKTIFEVIKSTRFVEKEFTEIPVYDTSRYGEVVSFLPPVDLDVVEQVWVVKPFTLVTILNNRRTHRNLYRI